MRDASKAGGTGKVSLCPILVASEQLSLQPQIQGRREGSVNNRGKGKVGLGRIGCQLIDTSTPLRLVTRQRGAVVVMIAGRNKYGLPPFMGTTYPLMLSIGR